MHAVAALTAIFIGVAAADKGGKNALPYAVPGTFLSCPDYNGFSLVQGVNVAGKLSCSYIDDAETMTPTCTYDNGNGKQIKKGQAKSCPPSAVQGSSAIDASELRCYSICPASNNGKGVAKNAAYTLQSGSLSTQSYQDTTMDTALTTCSYQAAQGRRFACSFDASTGALVSGGSNSTMSASNAKKGGDPARGPPAPVSTANCDGMVAAQSTDLTHCFSNDSVAFVAAPPKNQGTTSSAPASSTSSAPTSSTSAPSGDSPDDNGNDGASSTSSAPSSSSSAPPSSSSSSSSGPTASPKPKDGGNDGGDKGDKGNSGKGGDSGKGGNPGKGNSGKDNSGKGKDAHGRDAQNHGRYARHF